MDRNRQDPTIGNYPKVVVKQRVTRFRRADYFGQGEIARRIQPDGHAVEYLYDTEERLTGVRNQRGELYELRRDPLGRVVEEVDYWGQSRRYAYDASGHLQASIDPLGRCQGHPKFPQSRHFKFPHPVESCRRLNG